MFVLIQSWETPDLSQASQSEGVAYYGSGHVCTCPEFNFPTSCWLWLEKNESETDCTVKRPQLFDPCDQNVSLCLKELMLGKINMTFRGGCIDSGIEFDRLIGERGFLNDLSCYVTERALDFLKGLRQDLFPGIHYESCGRMGSGEQGQD